MKGDFMKRRLPGIVTCFVLIITTVVAVLIAANTETELSDLNIIPAALTAEDGVLPYLDMSLTFEERAADLVSRMTLTEKQSQMGNSAPAIPRLGINAYQWWREALHGVARDGRATSFPTSLSLAAMWDTDLMLQVGTVISTEARIKSNERNGTDLSYWSPTINLARDPRWGRNEETYGEDPFLTARTGEMFVRGMQGDPEYDDDYSSTYLKSIATIKHFAANNSEFNRHYGSSDMDDKTLRDYYAWTFQRITEKANVQSVMSSYNRVNGIPSSVNTYILDTLLRKTWGFDGYVVSDCGAIADVFNGHRWMPEGWTRAVDATEATAFAVKAGTDLNCGWVYQGMAANAVNAGLVTEDAIDLALVRLFTARMRTGEFDDPAGVSYRQIDTSKLEAPEHLDVSLQASRQAPVLLKNDDNNLPYDLSEINSIVVYGPIANWSELGDYSGSPTTTVSLRQGLTNYLASKNYSGTIEFLDGVRGGSGGSNQWLTNALWVRFGDDVRRAIDADDLNGLTIENNYNLAYITDYSHAIYRNVDISQFTSFSIDTAAPYDNQTSVVEVRAGSINGKLIAQVANPPTTGWQNYETRTAESVDISGLSGFQDIYVIFHNDYFEEGLIPEDIAKAKNADAAIVMVGSVWSGPLDYLKVAAEEADRTNLKLPANQDTLCREVGKLNLRTAVIMSSVGFHTVDAFIDDVKSFIYTSYNGQFQGAAFAEILFGEVNPSGRLPFTWYANDSDLPNIGDYDIRPHDGTPGRTYWYFNGAPQYPFGFGLGYTTFDYSNSSAVLSDDHVNITTDVTNTGSRKGAEIVEIYVAEPGAGDGVTAKKKLRGFTRVELDPGQTATVTISVELNDLSAINDSTGSRELISGLYEFQIGKSSEDIVWSDFVPITDPAGLYDALKTVTLRGDKAGVGSGGSFNSELTIVMKDETELNPLLARVIYASSNPTVAAVNQYGVVSGLKGGTAVITANVTYNGETFASSFPVAVFGPAVDITPPVITLLGGSNITVHKGDTFVEPGYRAVDDVDGDITNKVVVRGSVDTNVIGVYTLTYTVSDDAGNAVIATRIVNVINAEPSHATFSFSDKGKTGAVFNHSFTAPFPGTATITPVGADNKTQITVTIKDAVGNTVFSSAFSTNAAKTVNLAAGNYTVTIRIDNTNGNTNVGVNIVLVEGEAPLTPPTVRLIGSAQIILHLGGSPYVEQGVTATDATDGDISSHVVIESNVDTSKAGNYTVKYTVINTAGLSASVTRQVDVISQEKLTLPGGTYSFSPKGKQGESFAYGISSAVDGNISLTATVPNKTTIIVNITNSAGTLLFTETFTAASTRGFHAPAGNYTVGLMIVSANGNVNIGLGIATPGGEEWRFPMPETPR